MKKMSDFNSPKELLNAYKNGFVGSKCDPEDVDKLLGELPHPLFGAAAYNLYETGKGKVALLYKNVQKFDPGFGPSERQTTGDCLDGSSIVISKDCKFIKDVRVGDTIYDSRGNFTKVISTQVKISNNPMITIKTKGSVPLKVTSDHRVLIGRKEENYSGSTITKVITKKWVTAQEIKKGDYLITPVDLKTEEKPVNKFIQNGFEWFLGYFLGDGWCDNKQVEITFAEHQETFFNYCSEYLSQLGFTVKRGEYSKSKNTTAFRLRCWCPEFASFLRDMCYDENKKKVFPNWAIGSNDVLNGLVAADGMNKDGKQIFDSSSTSLAYGIYYSYLALGYKPTINYFHRAKKGAYKETQSYRVQCIFEKKKNYSFLKDNEFYIQVSKTEIKEGPHEVYDVGVAYKEHAFISNGCIVHNCVSHSTRNAIDVTRSTEIIGGEREEWVARSATEAIYGSRGHGGQGMSCSGAARFVHQNGGVLLRKDYSFVDLSKYNGGLGAGWGRRGVPSEVVKEAKKHQVKTISLIKTLEEARDAIANGYALSVCSGYGFSSRRDKYGIAKRSGGWNHAMAWVAMDDSREIYNETLFLVQNSWGTWNGGPKRFDQPEGSFWIRERDAIGMLSGGGAWVMSDVDGFPARKVSWTLEEVF